MDRDYVLLKRYGCSYIGQGPHACGSLELVEGKLYCAEHYALMYQKGTALRKRLKDTRKANAIRDIISDFNAAVEELEAEGFDLDVTPVTEELA
jgi:hypothetical protein